MNALKKLEAQKKRKLQKIQTLKKDRGELDVRIREEESYIQALNDMMKHLPKPEIDKNPAASLRPGSEVARAYEVLSQKGEPMHVMEILTALGRDETRETRQAMTSQLGNYVRQVRIFYRAGPNIFGLIEWKKTQQEAEEPGGDGNGDLLTDCDQSHSPITKLRSC